MDPESSKEIALLQKDIDYIKETVTVMNERMEDKYATKEYVDGAVKQVRTEALPVKRIVYGAAGVVLLSFVAALIAFVFKT